MCVLLTGSTDSYAQFITVLLLFVLVLGITALTTRWIANYQKQAGTNENIQVIETARIANNKFVQIIRTGEKYFVVAVCKDTVTMLGEIPGEQLKTGDPPQGFRFRELFDKTVKKQAEDRSGPKGRRVDE